MEDGSYWINDPSRYGWEVVRVMGDTFYRFGIEGGFKTGDFLLNGLEFLPVNEPDI